MGTVRFVLSGLLVIVGFIYLLPPTPYMQCVDAGETNCWARHVLHIKP